MQSPQHIIRENFAAIQQRVAQAAEESGRSAGDVTIVCVTKYVDVQLTKILIEAGATVLGESRPQELEKKSESLPNICWHMIGHLQRNKVRRLLPLVDLIHSVDSLRLLETIDEESAKLSQRTNLLLEANTSGEIEKHGFHPAELPGILEKVEVLKHVCIRGLMTMAAREGGVDVAQNNFAELRELRDQVRHSTPDNVELDELSMGMSGDFETAIAEGATLVRIGSLLWDGVDKAL